MTVKPAQLVKRPLFGGALELDVPSDYLDVR